MKQNNINRAICWLLAIALAMLPTLAQGSLNLNQQLLSHHFIMTENVVLPETTNKMQNHVRQVGANKSAHQVSFVLDFDTETQYATNIILINQDGKINEQELGIWQLNIGSNIASVPEGTYDILLVFAEAEYKGTEYENLYRYLYVIHEQVSIVQDMQLEFSSAEAKNHIHFKTLTIDGEAVNTGTDTLDENGLLISIEQGNMEDVVFQNVICSKDYGEIYKLWQRFGSTKIINEYQISNKELVGDFYVNDVSERYAFGSYRTAVDFDFSIFTTYNEVLGAVGDVTIANEPSKFILYEEPFMSPHQNNDYYHSVTFFLQNNGDNNFYHRLFFPLSISEAESIKCYIGANTEESSVGYIPYTQLQTYYLNTIVDDYGYEYEDRRIHISSVPVTKSNGTIVNVNNGTCNHGNSVDNWHFEQEWDVNNQVVKDYQLWPPHPVFTYSVDKKKGMLGNNCPILTTNPIQYDGSYSYENYEGNLVTINWISNVYYYQYLGRYGEITLDNIEKSLVSLKLDNETIYNGPGYFTENSNNRSPLQFEELFEGVVDATITCETVFVDDMVGTNKAFLHYIAGSEDATPPTMTMLHFRDVNDNVTDRFSTSEQGIIEFSAADFGFWYTPDNDYTYFRKAPDIVEVEYAPYESGNWNELPVEEVPENYWPVMGWFYTGSLADVTGQGLEGWFDLKIKLTDAAGNWQEQVLSPAFRIDDLAYSSVATITPASRSGDNVIYNLAGQRMRGDLNTLPHGVYIVNGKKVVK